MPADPRRVKDLFVAALDLPDSAARADFLDRECAGDAELRRRLDVLLAAHDNPESALERPLAATNVKPEITCAYAEPQEDADVGVGMIVAGRYKLLELIGEGGMGTVWMAEQRVPVKRLVALKLIRLGMDSRTVVARFEAERQALAMMDHPNIAKVLDGGMATVEHAEPRPSGSGTSPRPYFVMELVKGLPLTAYCDERRLSVADRLALFAQICNAVQHAHQKGVIHRDLKPSNVLVTEHDGRPVPKVIDFGLAKALNSTSLLTERTLHTAYGAVVGTPLYMAPEQVGINALDVDTRADIYALGVMLYELLTGSTPLEKKRFKEAAWDEVRRLIREEEPPRPSTRLSSSEMLPSLAASRQIEPAKLSRLIKGELDWIVMKALEKDRTRRYETANGFAADVLRYLSGEPVQAVPPSAGYRLRKFVRKYRRPIIAASLVFIVLLLGIIGTIFGLVWAVNEKRDADQARRAAEANEKRATEAGKQLGIARDHLRTSLYAARSNLIQSAWEAHGVLHVRELLKEQIPREGEPDLRGFEWHYWDRRANAELSVGPTAPEFERARVSRRILSPDGKRQAILWGGGLNTNGKVEVRDVPSGASIVTFDLPLPPAANRKPISYVGVSFTPDSEALFIAGLSQDVNGESKKAHWWLFDASTGKTIVPHQEAPSDSETPLDLGTHRTLLAAPVRAADPTKGFQLKLVAMATGKELRTCDNTFEALHMAAFRPDGSEIAAIITTSAAKKEWAIRIWDIATGRERLTIPVPSETGWGLFLVWSPDGKRLATGSRGLRIYDATDGREMIALTSQDDWCSSAVFSPDGSRIACVDAYAPARYILLRDTSTGQVRTTFKLTEEHVFGLAFAAGGTRLVTLSRFGTICTWDATANELPTELNFPPNLPIDRNQPPRFVTVSANGTTIAVAGKSADNETVWLQVWDITGKPIRTLTRPCPRDKRSPVTASYSVALSPDGKYAAWMVGLGGPNEEVVVAGARLTVIEVATGKEQWSQQLDRFDAAFWFSADGRLCTCFWSYPRGKKPFHDAIRFFDVESGREVHSMPIGLAAGEGLYLTRNGDFLFGLVSPDRSVAERSYRYKVWNLRERTVVATGNYPPDLVESPGMASIALSPDAELLAIAWRPFDAVDGMVRLLDLRSGKELGTLRGLDPFIGTLAFNHDGTRLAAVGRSLKIWDPATRQELITFNNLPGGVSHLQFLTQSHYLSAVCWNGQKYVLKLWDATPRIGFR